MDWAEIAILLVAGIGTGMIGYGAGLASLVSFPTLLALGLPPLTANITNTVALLGTTAGGLISAQPDLVGQRGRVVKFGIAGAIGGVVGAALLLSQPAETFEQIVPWLVAFASVVLMLRPWLRSLHADRIREHHVAVPVLIGLIAVYGGYFGAAAGVLIVATLGAVMHDVYARVNALRSVILGTANLGATVVFVIVTPIEWLRVAPLAVGCVLGASVAPPVIRRIPETPLRMTIGIAGLGLATVLFLDR
ncbi:MAG: Uncharacterized UPF0721 integral membrane protein [uncultured Propionibacteriaceae bacterium]|uniref:Probable membrane transporter protein n=1 Tax=uncultured Propionibacteriaceae bacterium TaxID=257457 RepID=A0A6J4PHI4_9ACTN|nr:MAG: Uncharacterized UPF0721 integral membrane protein [uncultured Propionibacteriaceae bacterium]